MEHKSPQEITSYRFLGGGIAMVTLMCWLMVEVLALFLVPIRLQTLGLFVPLVFLLSFLYTGLFITAHDAMHGLVFPSHPRWNRIIGTLAARMYALFSYEKLRVAHEQHHAHPGSMEDPDYHDGHRTGFWPWLVRFISHYMCVSQLLMLAALATVLVIWLHVPIANLILFWAVPAWLSVLQLFYFGTWLPHREPVDGYQNRHRARSNDFPVWLSFLTCYHFGYHYEHHEFPFVPWWKLPSVRNRILQNSNPVAPGPIS